MAQVKPIGRGPSGGGGSGGGPRLLRLPEVAEQLGVNERTVRRWVETEILPSVRIGPPANPRIRVPASELAAYIEAHIVKRAG